MENNFSGKNVLITGGLGFIGSNLATKLVSLGAKVTILDALLEPYGGNTFNIKDIEKDNQPRSFVEKVYEALLAKKLSREGLAEMCLMEGKKYSSISSALNIMLKDEGREETATFFFKEPLKGKHNNLNTQITPESGRKHFCPGLNWHPKNICHTRKLNLLIHLLDQLFPGHAFSPLIFRLKRNNCFNHT